MYWTIVFSIEIHFGLTEFRARIKWTDNVSNYLCYGKEMAYVCLSYMLHRTKSDSE
jgi:hypothetical protein